MTRVFLLAGFLCGATIAAADSHALWKAAKALNDARQQRVVAELDLARVILQAKQSLWQQGYASEAELALAEKELMQVETLRRAIAAYDDYLGRLSPESDGSLASPPERLIETPVGMLSVVNDVRIEELTQQIATAQRGRTGMLKALQRQADYQNELLDRLQQIGIGSVATDREIAFTLCRLAITRGQITMGHAKQDYEAELTLAVDADFVASLRSTWRQMRDAAKEHEVTEDTYDAALAAAGEHENVANWKQQQLRGLREIAGSSRELQRLEVEMELAEAKMLGAKERAATEIFLQVAQASNQAVDLIHLFDLKANLNGAIAVAEKELQRRQWKAAGCRNLHALGYVSWSEFAAAEQQEAVAELKLLAAQEDQHIAMLEWRRIKRALEPSMGEIEKAVALTD